ncbi:unnamed protein product [Merluccius merluccius]
MYQYLPDMTMRIRPSPMFTITRLPLPAAPAPPCIFPILKPKPARANLFVRVPLVEGVRSQQVETAVDLDLNRVCGVGCPSGAEKKPTPPRFLLQLQPRSPRAKLFKRVPIGSQQVETTVGLDLNRVCGVGCPSGAEKKPTPPRFLLPLPPRPPRAKLFKRIPLAEGIRSQQVETAGGLELNRVCGVGCTSGTENKATPPRFLPPLEPRPSRSGRLFRKARPLSPSFTLKGEKHQGTLNQVF